MIGVYRVIVTKNNQKPLDDPEFQVERRHYTLEAISPQDARNQFLDARDIEKIPDIQGFNFESAEFMKPNLEE